MSFLTLLLGAIVGYILLNLGLKRVLKAAFRIFNKLALKIGIIRTIQAIPSKNIDTFIGIVQGDEPNQLSIGIIDVSRKLVSFKSFVIEEVPLEQSISMHNKKIFSSDINKLGEFIESQVLDSKTVQVLLEIPSAILETNSIYLKIILFLSAKGYCEFDEFIVFEQNKVQLQFQYVILPQEESQPIVQEIPEEMRLKTRVKRGIMYLQPNMSRAYAQFLLGSCSSPECAAVFAALIAKNKNLYYFMTSNGQVQSSQDLLWYIKHPQEEPTSVISGNELFTIAKTSITRLDKVEKIPLEYAVATKKSEFLGKNDAIKFGLLKVCKVWKINLYCASCLDEKSAYLWNCPCDENFTTLITKEEYLIYNPQARVFTLG